MKVRDIDVLIGISQVSTEGDKRESGGTRQRAVGGHRVEGHRGNINDCVKRGNSGEFPSQRAALSRGRTGDSKRPRGQRIRQGVWTACLTLRHAWAPSCCTFPEASHTPTLSHHRVGMTVVKLLDAVQNFYQRGQH